MIATVLPLLLLSQSPREPVLRTIDVDGTKREAVIYPGGPSQGRTSLVLVFHGHGGTAQGAAEQFGIHKLWPEAVVAYMQGLPGVPGVADPEGKKTGWQKMPGEVGDRDVKFVDRVIELLEKEHRIDNRVFALGHSNGARFTNVLWSMRGKKLAALCSAAAQGGALLTSVDPKPIFMIAGRQDEVAPFRGQVQSIEFVRKLLKTDPSKAVTKGYARMEPGTRGSELVAYIHPGGHEFPEAAVPMVVDFFKRNAKP